MFLHCSPQFYKTDTEGRRQYKMLEVPNTIVKLVEKDLLGLYLGSLQQASIVV